MSRRIMRILLVVQLITVSAGTFIFGRTLYRYARWQWQEYRAGQQWQSYCQAPRQSAQHGSPACWLRSEEAGLDTLVLNGADKKNLALAPCLEGSTPNLKANGFKLILGHRDQHFRKLQTIASGHIITVDLPEGKKKSYRVMETEILQPDQVKHRIAGKRSEDWLALVTCYPFKYTGPAPERFIVYAARIQ